MPKILKIRCTTFFVLAVILLAIAAFLLIFNPLKAQPRAGANACTYFDQCLESGIPPIGQLNGKYCTAWGEKISDQYCACDAYNYNNLCVRTNYICSSDGSNHTGWGKLVYGAVQCGNFGCLPNECTVCNQRCNSTGTASVYDATCSSLCALSYVNNQMSTAQDASFWMKNDGKLGPDNNNYIYVDPTVSTTTQNSLYVTSNSTSGNFIKLDYTNQEKFRVDKEGNTYMNDLYASNIVLNQTSGQLENNLYSSFNNGYRPYFSTTYHFTNLTGNNPAGSGKYIFVGVNDASNNSFIYIIREDNGQIVEIESATENIAGMAVGMYSGEYWLYYTVGNNVNSRAMKRGKIEFTGADNQPQLTTIATPGGLSGKHPFYILALGNSNTFYMTDNVNNQLIRYNLGSETITFSTTLSGLQPYALAIQYGTTLDDSFLWVTAWDADGSVGRLLKRSLFSTGDLDEYNLTSSCKLPKLLTVDKYNNVWITCSDTSTYYGQAPTSYSRNHLVKFNGSWPEIIDVPYYTGSSYDKTSYNSLPFGIIYNSALDEIVVGNRKDGRLYRFTLSGNLVNCDGSLVLDQDALTDLQACLIANNVPVGQLIKSDLLGGESTFFALSMANSNPNPSIYYVYPSIVGDLIAPGHVASFGFFLQGANGAGHEKLLIDLSGYNDKISFVGYQTNVGQTGDRAGMYFFGDNSGSSEYDLGQFIVQSEVVNLGPNYNGAAAANTPGTLNKGKIYLRGMTMLGIDDSPSPVPVLLTGTENLLYGNINSFSTGGNLILLQNGLQDKFKVDKDGNTTVSGNLTVTGNISDSDSDVTINDGLSVANALKTPGGLEVLGSDLNASCTTAPAIKTDGTMYVCKWCASKVQHRELRVWLLNSWYTIRDNTNSVTNCNSI